MGLLDDIKFESVIPAIVISAIQDIQEPKTAQNTSLPRHLYLKELLSSSL
jgi:hypothetical protein